MVTLMLRGLICLLACGNLVSSQPQDSEPTDVPEDTKRPKDYNNCKINANTVYAWIVAVYSQQTHTILGHGSMITYNALLSTCRQYQIRSSYIARAQFLWNLTLPLDPCAQDKPIERVTKHPRCAHSSTATFFDFAVLKLTKPFDITGLRYPTLTFPITPEDLLFGIQYINRIPNTVGCMIPSFLEQGDRIPVFDWDTFVEAIPFRTQCIILLCEKTPPNPTYTATCRTNFGERANGTQLCMTYRNKTRSFPLGAGDQYWIAGTPLVCNATTYGVAAQPHLKTENPNLTSEIHYVVTLLRVWQWLIRQISANSAPKARSLHSEDYQEPNRPPNQRGETIPSPEVRGDADSLVASISSSVPALIIYCFNKLM